MNEEFRWPAELFDQEIGLRLATLESVADCDRLFEHAVEFAGWPGGLDGRIQFHALALYALRVGKSPGATLTSAVRSQRFGRFGWPSAADKVAAARRIGASTPNRSTRRIAQATPQTAPVRDWTLIDAEIDQMTDGEAFELLPNQFTRDMHTRAAAAGKSPRKLPALRIVIRRAVEAGQSISR